MRTRPIAALWMGAAFCAALGLAAGALIVSGTRQSGIHEALRATARLGFLFFWPAYAGGALVSLFGPTFQPLKRRGREFGLAFASVLLVHLGLVAWLCLIGAAPPVSTFIVFGLAAAWTYILALFSIGRLHQALGREGWRLLRVVALNYIAYAFAIDFLRNPFDGGVGLALEYLPFAIFAVVGPILALATLAQRAVRVWRPSTARATEYPSGE